MNNKELNNFYYTYSNNFLTASKEFQEIDSTFSQLFLNISKMLLERIQVDQGERIIQTSISVIENLPEDEKQKIKSEFEEIENLIEDEIKNEK